MFVDQGWLIDETEIQLRFYKNPIKLFRVSHNYLFTDFWKCMRLYIFISTLVVERIGQLDPTCEPYATNLTWRPDQQFILYCQAIVLKYGFIGLFHLIWSKMHHLWVVWQRWCNKHTDYKIYIAEQTLLMLTTKNTVRWWQIYARNGKYGVTWQGLSVPDLTCPKNVQKVWVGLMPTFRDSFHY